MERPWSIRLLFGKVLTELLPEGTKVHMKQGKVVLDVCTFHIECVECLTFDTTYM